MSRTTLLQERRMQTFQDVLGHWQAQRLSALEAAGPPAYRRRSRPRATAQVWPWWSAIPTSAASPPAAWSWCWTTCTTTRRSPCAAWPWRSSSACTPRGSASTRRRPTATPRCARPKRSGANGRDGACSTSTPTRNPTPSSFPPPSIRTASSRLRSTWCGKPASSSGCTAGSSRRSSRTAARPA